MITPDLIECLDRYFNAAAEGHTPQIGFALTVFIRDYGSQGPLRFFTNADPHDATNAVRAWLAKHEREGS